MNVVKCAVCGAKMRRNGKTKAGKTRWRCESCGSSSVVHVENVAKRLFEVRTSEQAAAWTASYAGWCASYDEFLREETVDDEGHAVLTHERLVKARNSLTCLVRQNTPFTYADPASWQGSGPCPPPTTLLKAQAPSSVTCSGSTAGFRSNAALRQFTGGVTCIRSARCPPPGS